MNRCEGKNVVVVGGTRGIGRATTLSLAQEGANVIATGRSSKSVAELREFARSQDLDVSTAVLDIVDPVESRHAIDEIVDRVGVVHGIVANAGISPVFVRAETLDVEIWDQIMVTNLRGLFFVVQAAAIHMLAQEAGSIVSISSVTSMAGTSRGLPYAASKGGLDAMTRTLAVEWADRGVRVNAVAPGFVATDLTESLKDNPILAKAVVLDKVPMGRFGNPEEISSLITFLISDEASFITGQVYVADGGYLAS